MQRTVDYLIIGGGPAGLQLAYFLKEADRDYLVLERSDHVGSFFSKYPRIRNLISINKIYTGYDDPELQLRWDWNSLLSDDLDLRFRNYSREYWADPSDLVRYLKDFASSQELNVELNTTVSTISREDGEFVVAAADGRSFRAKRLIVATGISKPNVPDIPGIEFAELYTELSTDREEYADERVLILGKGNSAFEIANLLTPTARLIHVASPDPLRMAWTTHYVGDLRAINNEFLDTYQLKSQNAVLNASVRKIKRAKEGGFEVTVAYNMADGEVEVLHYDRVLCCTGFKFDAGVFDETCSPELRHCGRLPEQTHAWESVNIPGLYFAGVLNSARDYRKTTSAFIHGFRYNCRALNRIFNQRYHEEPWPIVKMPAEPRPVQQAMLARINSSSALWQQFGFLCDAVIVRGAEAEYLEEVPVDYLFSGELDLGDTLFTVTLEYGDKKFDNPFAAERVHREDIRRADASQFLHPIVRQYDGKIFVDEHHLIEDLEAEWNEEIHTKPLLHWLRLHYEDRRRNSA